MDNQSNMHVLSELRLLKDISQIYSWIDIHCNSGVTRMNWFGNLPRLGRVWYHLNGISNILSLYKIFKHFRITYYIWDRNAFAVHKSARAVKYFMESPRGLFYMDIKDYHVKADLVTKVSDKKSN